MNAKDKLHQAKLSYWSDIFHKQTSSGLNAKEWCSQNSVSIYAYNYWKHKLKETVVDSMLPDIVPVNTSLLQPQSVPDSSHDLYDSRNSYDSLDLQNQPAILTISYKDIRIEIGASVSDQQILQMIRAVRYA